MLKVLKGKEIHRNIFFSNYFFFFFYYYLSNRQKEFLTEEYIFNLKRKIREKTNTPTFQEVKINTS
jgi:hypothetical protein